MKFLCIDYGQKRTGIAKSNPEGTIAFPLTTIKMSTRYAFFTTLFELAHSESAEAFVVGMPTHIDGKHCLATSQVEHMVERLKRRTSLPIYIFSEVLSSFEAEQDLREVKKYSRKNKELIDQQAAVRILQSFLDELNSKRRFEA